MSQLRLYILCGLHLLADYVTVSATRLYQCKLLYLFIKYPSVAFFNLKAAPNGVLDANTLQNALHLAFSFEESGREGGAS